MSLEVDKEFSDKLTQSKFKIAVKNVSLSEFQDGCIVRFHGCFFEGQKNHVPAGWVVYLHFL